MNSQLCHLLRLRAIAVVSPEPEFEKTALWLRSLGAAEVLLDSGSLKVGAGVTRNRESGCCGMQLWHAAGTGGVGKAIGLLNRPIQALLLLGPSLQFNHAQQAELDRAKFFSKPRLALDCVGGASAARLVDCLAEGGQLVVRLGRDAACSG